MSRSSARMVSGRDVYPPLAQAADKDLTRHDSSSEHTDGFATATSSPAETGSEEDQDVTFRLRSGSHSEEYAFIIKWIVHIHFTLYPTLPIPFSCYYFSNILSSYKNRDKHRQMAPREIDSLENDRRLKQKQLSKYRNPSQSALVSS